MSSRQFYVFNILSALIWAPAHVFPGVLLGMALNLAGLSPGQLVILLIVGLIAGIGGRPSTSLLLESAAFSSRSPEDCPLDGAL